MLLRNRRRRRVGCSNVANANHCTELTACGQSQRDDNPLNELQVFDLAAVDIYVYDTNGREQEILQALCNELTQWRVSTLIPLAAYLHV